jgi:hypothetical protein
MPSRVPKQRSGSLLGSALDVASDAAVLWFAAWTLIAYVGMLTDAAATLLVWVWLATIPLVGAALWFLRPAIPTRAEPRPPRAPRRVLQAVSLAGGVAFGVLLALGDRIPWPAVWAPAAVSVVAMVAAGRLKPVGGDGDAPAPAGLLADLTAAAFAFAFAVMSLFIFNGNADDAFYVNRATATAQLNRIPIKDVLFTREQVPPISGSGLPVDTLHALQGAVARFIGVEAPSVVYFVTPPIASFLATWALWRLVRAWAPRFALLCFALGCLYWVWSAKTDLTHGSFFISRIWQGKVIFVAWMVPTLYVLLTRWIRRNDLRAAVLLLAAALASIGLTASGTFVAPLVCAAAALPLIANKAWRELAVVALAGAIPLLIGGLVSHHYGISDDISRYPRDNYWIFTQVFAPGVVGAIGAVALWSSPWFARTRGIAAGVAVITALLLVPGVLALIRDVVGLSETLRRLLWLVPLPALVGLLAAAPARRSVAAATAAAAAALLIAFGTPLWTGFDGDASWTSRPTWKTNGYFVDEARTILAHYHGSGSVLASKSTMRALALITVEPKAVDARTYYAQLLPGPPRWIGERSALARLATSGTVPHSNRFVRHALKDLDVSLVCLPADKPKLPAKAGLTPTYQFAFSTREADCFVRRP